MNLLLAIALYVVGGYLTVFGVACFVGAPSDDADETWICLGAFVFWPLVVPLALLFAAELGGSVHERREKRKANG